ncbi:uncharacterized protein PHALS_06620 [Plasmopara halstedii]|uniref:Uncharacterized protein n=1 Tax=Plasmopara halstedii TaxID=4781 RepID=A0A0P1B5N8_PLAHL|nr:uncharacterized protein PHALS_06620 [Plasmopara halstedii]CEG48820.1 hypothetical protein PHALS_06620 [Plasmopara halstedii]|eukprot:XP_024585189.1 hypothetical protein PHALS_06620 [Plasmopara halstedii]
MIKTTLMSFRDVKKASVTDESDDGYYEKFQLLFLEIPHVELTQISGLNTIEVSGQFKNTRRDPRQVFDATRRCLHLYNVFVGEILERGHNNHET